MSDDYEDPIKLLEKGFDCVVMGTGLTECILSGIYSVQGKRVLHIDRNKYYGGEGASLKISQLYEKYLPGVKPNESFGKDRDWNIDLIPKFLMAGGELANILRQLKQVQDNVQFQQIAGSYVYRGPGGGFFGTGNAKVHKVPSSAMEAATSSLIGLMEKGRLKSFLECVSSYKPGSGSLHAGLDLDKTSMTKVYDHFSLEPATRDFVGHAMALYLDDEYLEKPARETFERVYMYATSVAMYGKSPYIYPLYGLGELPSGFTRLSAVHGGTYMLDTEVLDFEYDDGGKVKGVKIKFEDPKRDGHLVELSVPTPKVIADPSYVSEGKKKKATGHKVIRAICVLNHAVKDTSNADSSQIIIPQSQVNRKHDIYVAVVSSAHNVCPKGYWLAIVSTIVETDNPQHELKSAFDILEPIEETFMSKPVTLYEQADDASDNIFVSQSFDATSHFETCTDDVKGLYKRMEKKDLDIKEIAPKDQPAE